MTFIKHKAITQGLFPFAPLRPDSGKDSLNFITTDLSRNLVSKAAKRYSKQKVFAKSPLKKDLFTITCDRFKVVADSPEVTFACVFV